MFSPQDAQGVHAVHRFAHLDAGWQLVQSVEAKR